MNQKRVAPQKKSSFFLDPKPIRPDRKITSNSNIRIEIDGMDQSAVLVNVGNDTSDVHLTRGGEHIIELSERSERKSSSSINASTQ